MLPINLKLAFRSKTQAIFANNYPQRIYDPPTGRDSRRAGNRMNRCNSDTNRIVGTLGTKVQGALSGAERNSSMKLSTKSMPWVGGAAVTFAAILWAVDGLLRESLQTLDPLTVVFAEHLVGTLVAIPILLVLRKRIKPLTTKQKWTILLVAGLSGVLGTTLFVGALFKVFFAQFSVVILLQQLQPLFAITASAILLKEKVTPRFAGLAALAIAGAYLLNFPDLTVNFDTGETTTIAGLMAVGAAAAWGTSTAFSKYSLKGTFWVQITALRFALATLIAGVALWLMPVRNTLSMLTNDNLMILLAIALSTGFAAVALYYFGLQRIRASRATILELAFPVTAVFIGYFKFGNQLTFTQILGALIVTGVSIYLIRNEGKLKTAKAS